MHINIQPISKFEDADNGDTLLVHSIFHTIQGEGPFTGHPAIFVRLGGCNLQCPQCDTEYTQGTRRMMTSEILREVRTLHSGPRLVVITGGEPFRQNITPLALALIDEDYYVQVETNGTLPPSLGFPAITGGWDYGKGAWIVVSPKAGKVHAGIEALAVAWKYVLNADSVDAGDGLPLRVLDHSVTRTGVARPPENFPVEAIYLQAADVKNEELNGRNLAAVLKSCMRHGYTLQLQIHKLLGME